MRVNRRVYNTSAFQSYDIEVPAVGTGSTSLKIISTIFSAYSTFLFLIKHFTRNSDITANESRSFIIVSTVGTGTASEHVLIVRTM